MCSEEAAINKYQSDINRAEMRVSQRERKVVKRA